MITGSRKATPEAKQKYIINREIVKIKKKFSEGYITKEERDTLLNPLLESYKCLLT